MTQLLENAFQHVAQLPEQEQDIIADWLMQELAAEQRWDQAFTNSADKLAALAREALEEPQARKARATQRGKVCRREKQS